MQAARPFVLTSTNYGKTILVLGDSTAIGVGASRPRDSIAGRVAAEVGATYVENNAATGAKVAQVFNQVDAAQLGHYDIILLQVGGNDIIRFGNADLAKANLKDILRILKEKGDTVYLMMAGDVGRAKLFPPFVRPFHHFLSMQYRANFIEAAEQAGVIYIDLYVSKEKDPFVKDPLRYHAKDGLHPSTDGYDSWFKKLAPQLSPIE